MSKHKQLLADYQALRAIACGNPYDSGEYYDQFADDMIERPTAKEACRHLEHLIDMYHYRGGPLGEDLKDNPDAREIFIRNRLMDADDD